MYAVGARMQKLETLIDGLDAQITSGDITTTVSDVVDHSDRVTAGVSFKQRALR